MSYSTTHLAEIAAPADPGSYVIDPTPAMMGGGEASWSRGGGCASCQLSITENAAAGREASNTPAYAPLLPARPLSDVDACGFPYCAECPPSER